MPQVNIPQVGLVNFPDSMSQDDIVASIKTKIIPQFQAKQSATGTMLAGVIKNGAPQHSDWAQPEDPGVARMGALGTLNDIQTGLQHQTPPQAQTVGQGVQNFGINTISSLTEPKTALLGAGLGGLGLVPKVGIPLMRLALLGLGTKMASEGLGQASPGSGATPGERTEGLLNAGMGGLMGAGGLAEAPKELPPEHLRPDVQRPLTVAEINERAGLKPQATKPAIQLGSGQELAKTPEPFAKGKLMANTPPVKQPDPNWQVTVQAPQEIAPGKVVPGYVQIDDVTGGQNKWSKSPESLAKEGVVLPDLSKLPQGKYKLSDAIKKSSEPSPTPEKSILPSAAVPAPAAAPLTFKPAVRIGNKIVEGQHGAAAQKAFMEAQKAGNPNPKIERGAVDSEGKWYASPMEVARKQMELKAPQPTKANEKEDETSPELRVPGREGQVQEKQPGNVGAGERGGEQGGARSKDKALTKEEKQVEQARLRKELGFTITPKSMWESLFNGNKGTKIDPQQMFNRIKNKLGEGSSTFKWLASNGLQSFLSTPRSTEEVQKWAEENQPKVVVRKFGEANQTPEQKELADVVHNWRDRLPQMRIGDLNDARLSNNPSARLKQLGWKQPDIDQAVRYYKLGEQVNKQDRPESAHWSSVAPKSEKDMPGYVEIAVVKPPRKVRENLTAREKLDLAKQGKPWQTEETTPQFPSSHSFPPNTLGFVRGYMENVGGKKVFHVIEVQSDWAQRVRDTEADRGISDAINQNVERELKQLKDPLLPHYERLALKAAIEHARQEGATHIAVSDAETAMMTEGHDRGYDGPGNPEDQGFGNGRARPTQEPGMRLHYDQTLPKILGELTGGKGERVEMGEHRMAWQDGHNRPPMEGERQALTKRKDLIFRNPDGTPKTSVSGKLFPLEKANQEFTFFGKDRPGEAGFIDVGAIADTLKDLYKDKLDPAWKEFKQVWERHVLRASGESLPFHGQKDKQLGNVAYLVGQAPAIANRLAEVDPKIVLNGEKEDSEFDKVLGSVWTEAQLRDKRSQLFEQGRDDEARKVETVVGNGRSPITDEAHYQTLLKNPKVQEATMDFKRLIGNKAQQRQENLGGKIARQPGMGFVNLLVKDEAKQPATSGLRGAQLKGSALNQTRTGTGTSYDVSATRMMQNSIKANYYRSALADYYKAAESKGVGKWVKAGDPVPEGYQAVPQDITKLVLKEDGETTLVKTIRKDFYLDKKVMPEFRRITNLDRDAFIANDHKLAEFLTKLQVEAGIDALGHSGNIVAAVNSAAKAELGKNIIGAREASTIADITKIVGQELSQKPEFLHIAHAMAERGILREAHTMQGLLGEFSPGGAIIKHLDSAGRQVLYRAAVDMANKGLGKADIIDIRRQIDKQMGQYNPRLMTAWQHIMRSVFSPFSVASRTFNSLATQRLLLSPGFQAANKTAWAKLAARQLAYAATAYFVAPMLLNYEQTGEMFPEGVKFGEGVISKEKNGTYKTFDFLKLNFMRRALRVTGLGKVMEGQVLPRLRGEPVQSLDSTGRAAAMDVIGGKIAPYTAGPIPQAASALILGKTPAGFDVREKGETQPPYFKAALRTLNPVSGALMQGQVRGDTTAPLVKRLEQTVGVGSSSKPEQVINGLRRQFLFKIGKAKQADYPPSDYDTLRSLLAKGDTEGAKKEYEELLAKKTEEHQFGKDPEGEAKKQLQTYFTMYAKGHGNVSKEDEAAFVKTLTPHQLDLYNETIKQKQAVADAFFSLQPKQNKAKGFGSLKF